MLDIVLRKELGMGKVVEDNVGMLLAIGIWIILIWVGWVQNSNMTTERRLDKLEMYVAELRK